MIYHNFRKSIANERVLTSCFEGFLAKAIDKDPRRDKFELGSELLFEMREFHVFIDPLLVLPERALRSKVYFAITTG